MLLMRIIFGVLMMKHGYDKLLGFADMKTQFMSFMGLGSTTSLALCIFAEFFCALFVILGLFTRPAAIALVINAIVAVVLAHNMDFFGDAEKITLFLGAFLSVLVMGPGKISVDSMIGK